MSDFSQHTGTLAAKKLELLKRLLKQKGIAVGVTPTIQPRATFSPCPMSFAQQRLWFLDHLLPGNSLHNIPEAMRFRGRLEVEALRRTLDELVRRHESLRTTFAAIDGQPMQIINPPAPVSLALIDLSELSAPEREAALHGFVKEQAWVSFDLTQGPLLRVNLLRLSAEEHVVLFVLHHIIWDGWSMEVLTREVSVLYEAFCHGRPAMLPELTIQYADYAIWQRGWLQGETLRTELSYWKEQLNGAPPVQELPLDRPRPATSSYRGAEEFITMDAESLKRLNELSQREGATLFMTLLAAFQALLYQYTGQEDIVVGTPIAGRHRSETEQLIGFFINTLVLRTRVHGNPNFRELLGRAREVALGAYAHQDVPFEMVVDEVAPERSLSVAPLTQVMIGLQNSSPTALNLTGLTLSHLDMENAAARFDLYLSIINTEQTLALTISYSVDLFEAATIKRMLRHYAALLRHVSLHPEGTCKELANILSLSDREERAGQEKEFQESSLRQLKGIRRRAVRQS